jgi:superfamily II DNA/RNA helicase
LVNKASGRKAEEYVAKNRFSDFDLCDQLKSNIQARGYVKPTPIQDQVIPHLVAGKDVVGIANTGTGKTAAFLIPLSNKVYLNRNQKVLIVTPTRELATQIEDEFRIFTKQMGLFSVLCIGGAPIGRQMNQLRRHPHFVIGTPGRLQDLEKRRLLHLADYSSIVLDEVDRMFDMGFLPEIKKIISFLPAVRQSLFFSATMPDKIRQIANDFLRDPISVSIQAGRPADNIDQDIVRLNGETKIEILHKLLIQKGFDKVLVFGRTKRGIENLVRTLQDRGFQAVSIHGNKSQGQRYRALDQFKRNAAQIMVATDVASRGLDIDDVTHVINYDLPESYEDYLHRIGRTGRIDKKGTALTFVD